VLTLDEAAAFLRLPAVEVLRLIREQDLPARRIGTDWRFFKKAIEEWLSQPPSKANKEGIWAFAGAWKDDPHAEEMLKEIYRRRGRPMTPE
jgi:excisionase family DNA binding protein